MKTLYYKFLTLLFYYIGDVACKFSFEIAFEIYQKSMNLSIHFDEKLGFWLWKKPVNDTNL
jgi:hypothetical protein